MTLFEYLDKRSAGEEVPVCDNEYDMLCYFYNDQDDPDDDWQNAMLRLAKLLTVLEQKGNHVTVNFSELIKKKLSVLKEAELFTKTTVDAIMENMHGIISGYVGEEWFIRFVSALGTEQVEAF